MATPKFDVKISGMALETEGLTEWNTYDAFALLTEGLIYGCQNIWFGPWNSNGDTLISSTWSLCAGTTVSTNWSLCAGVTTTWTLFSTYYKEDC